MNSALSKVYSIGSRIDVLEEDLNIMMYEDRLENHGFIPDYTPYEIRNRNEERKMKVNELNYLLDEEVRYIMAALHENIGVLEKDMLERKLNDYRRDRLRRDPTYTFIDNYSKWQEIYHRRQHLNQ